MKIFFSIAPCNNAMFSIQEKQLKKVRAKQRRLQAILGGEDTQRVEAELLAEFDEDEGKESFSAWDRLLSCSLYIM